MEGRKGQHRQRHRPAFAENQAMKLRRGTKGIFTNVYIKGWATGFDIEHDETLAFVGTALKVVGLTIDSDVPTITKGKTTSGASATISASFYTTAVNTGAGNGAGMPSWAAGWAVGFAL